MQNTLVIRVMRDCVSIVLQWTSSLLTVFCKPYTELVLYVIWNPLTDLRFLHRPTSTAVKTQVKVCRNTTSQNKKQPS